MGGRRQRGFTLLELMMAIAVIGILAAVAVPSFITFRLNSRMTSAANDLLTDLNAARSEAIKRQRPVAFCGSTNPDDDEPDCDAAVTGWVVWVDTNNDRVIDPGEALIRQHGALPTALTVQNNFTSISYGANGFSQDPAAATMGILLCDDRGNESTNGQFRKRIVTLSATGRPTVVKAEADVAQLPEPADPIDQTWRCPA